MKLIDYLQKRGLTVSEFANEAELSAEGLRLILKGLRQPRRSTVERIRRASNGAVTPFDLVELQHEN